MKKKGFLIFKHTFGHYLCGYFNLQRFGHFSFFFILFLETFPFYLDAFPLFFFAFIVGATLGGEVLNRLSIMREFLLR